MHERVHYNFMHSYIKTYTAILQLHKARLNKELIKIFGPNVRAMIEDERDDKKDNFYEELERV